MNTMRREAEYIYKKDPNTIFQGGKKTQKFKMKIHWIGFIAD